MKDTAQFLMGTVQKISVGLNIHNRVKWMGQAIQAYNSKGSRLNKGYLIGPTMVIAHEPNSGFLNSHGRARDLP